MEQSIHSTTAHGGPTRWLALGVLALLGLAACSGGGSSTDSSGLTETKSCDVAAPDAEENCGTVIIGLTDDEGDFLNYTVGILSIKLERADGTIVETLPEKATLNFAEYVDLTEFFTAAFVPPGVYVAGSVTLDYSDADIAVEVDGQAREAIVVGTDGNPLTTYELKIRLEDQRKLVIARGIPSLLTIDFNLDISHEVDTSVSPPIVVADPFLVADIDPVDSKEIRLRGLLLGVQLDESTYTVAVRPYHLRHGRFGRVKVHTNSATIYEINGEMFEGFAGLEEMATLEELTPTVAFGLLDIATRQFKAKLVFAGSSVPGHGFDVVRGNVISRSGDEIVVRGATVIKNDETGSIESIIFNDNVVITLGPETKVLKTGDRATDLDIGAISVGQKVWAFGTLTSTMVGELALDATEGRVRLLVTRVSGTVNSLNPDELEMTAQTFDRRRVGLFDFSGTGISEADDADPDHYQVATHTLSLDGLNAGAPVRVFGFVTPFGAAPPDFEGRTIVDFSKARATLTIGWGEGTLMPFSVIGEEGIMLDLSNPEIGKRHHIKQGGVWIDLLGLSASPNIVPFTEHPGVYAIMQQQTVQVFFDFGAFVKELDNRLDGSTTEALGMHASGGYDAIQNIFTAKRIWVRLD